MLTVDEHIFLKRLEMPDASGIFNLVEKNRLFLRRWLPWVDLNTSIDETAAFIKSSQDQYAQNLGFSCGIWFCEQLVGVIGFQRIDWMNRNVEIGYWLDEQFQGNGIITRSCRAMIDFAFHEYQLHRVQIRCAVENEKSRSIIQRLGFLKEGTTRHGEFLYNRFVDLEVYGMIVDDWNDLHPPRSAQPAGI